MIFKIFGGKRTPVLPISVCMIAKNEEQNIEKALAPFRDLGVELVIVDTGSTDQTVALASQYTERIYHFQWCNDFSAARNFSVSKASHDWILVVDFDEYLEHINTCELLDFGKRCPTGIGTVMRHNSCRLLSGQESVMTEQVARFFNRNYHHYVGTIHEQVLPKDGSEPSYHPLNVSFYHQGYEKEEMLIQKSKRNLTLLLDALKSNPQDPYLLYQTGKCYQVLKDYQAACHYFDAGLSYDLDPALTYVQDMVVAYGYCLLELKEYSTALNLANIYDIFGSHADFVFLMGLIYMNNALFDQAIIEFKKAVSMNSSNVEGINSYAANYNIGVIYECTGQIGEAVKYYRKCGDYLPALNRLKAISL